MCHSCSGVLLEAMAGIRKVNIVKGRGMVVLDTHQKPGSRKLEMTESDLPVRKPFLGFLPKLPLWWFACFQGAFNQNIGLS